MSCSCGTCNGCLSTDTISIPTGANGTNGTNGSNGVFGGFSGSWLFDNATSDGPDATNLRFNNATLASVSEIYVNDTNKDSVDYSAFLASFSNGSDFGTVRVFKRYDSTQFWIGTVTAVTDNTSFYTIAVTWISSNGTFTDEDELVVSFTASGADGTGTSGATMLDSVYDITIAAATVGPVEFTDITIDANQLGTDNDTLEVSAYITSLAEVEDNDQVYYISFGATGYTASTSELTQYWKGFIGKAHLINWKCIRRSATTIEAQIKVQVSSGLASNGTNTYPEVANYDMIGSYTHTVDLSIANIIQIGVMTNPTNSESTLKTIDVKYVPANS